MKSEERCSCQCQNLSKKENLKENNEMSISVSPKSFDVSKFDKKRYSTFEIFNKNSYMVYFRILSATDCALCFEPKFGEIESHDKVTIIGHHVTTTRLIGNRQRVSIVVSKLPLDQWPEKQMKSSKTYRTTLKTQVNYSDNLAQPRYVSERKFSIKCHCTECMAISKTSPPAFFGTNTSQVHLQIDHQKELDCKVEERGKDSDESYFHETTTPKDFYVSEIRLEQKPRKEAEQNIRSEETPARPCHHRVNTDEEEASHSCQCSCHHPVKKFRAVSEKSDREGKSKKDETGHKSSIINRTRDKEPEKKYLSDGGKIQMSSDRGKICTCPRAATSAGFPYHCKAIVGDGRVGDDSGISDSEMVSSSDSDDNWGRPMINIHSRMNHSPNNFEKHKHRQKEPKDSSVSSTDDNIKSTSVTYLKRKIRESHCFKLYSQYQEILNLSRRNFFILVFLLSTLMGCFGGLLLCSKKELPGVEWRFPCLVECFGF